MKTKTYILVIISAILATLSSILVLTTFTTLNAQMKKVYSGTSLADTKILSVEEEKAYSFLSDLGEDDVKIVFTSNETLNCGAEKSETNTGGCYRHSTPDRIYVSPGSSEEILKYLVYHEYAHLLHHRTNQEGGECEADKQAMEWGADIRYSGYSECELIDQYGIIKNFNKKLIKKDAEN